MLVVEGEQEEEEEEGEGKMASRMYRAVRVRTAEGLRCRRG